MWRGKKTNKFGNEVVSFSGRSFHSKLEAAVYQVLKLRELAGEIEVIQVQDQVYLSQARIGYRADFKCRWTRSGELFWVESKGFETPEWKLKKKLWGYYGPGDLEIWVGDYRKPRFHGTVSVRATKYVPELSISEYEEFQIWKKEREPKE